MVSVNTWQSYEDVAKLAKLSWHFFVIFFSKKYDIKRGEDLLHTMLD
jgi:hypothetical protein